MVNRYDNPAQAQFMNTYVPIPFEQLYTLGKEAKADVDKAMSAVGSAFDKWSEFKSPSQVDTQAFYDETIGRAMPYIEQLSTNLDLIKTPEGRAKLNTLINNVDRAKLSNLKQSAEGLKERQKVNQELMIRGKYNPMWHDLDFTNYSTMDSGTFTDTAPLAYMNAREISDPFFKELKPGYIKTEGMYDYFGNTREDVESVVNAKFNDIVSTPEASKHMQVYMQQTGANAEQAQRWFRDQLIQSNLDRTIRPERRPNAFAEADYKAALAVRAAARKQADKEGQPNPDIYAQTYTSDNMAMINKIMNNPNFAGVFTSKDEAEMTQQMQQGIQRTFALASGIVPSAGVAKDKIPMYSDAADRVLSELSVPSTGILSSVYNKNKANTVVDVNINNVPIKGYIVPNTQGAILSTEYVNKAMGVAAKEAKPKIKDNNGMLRDFEEEIKNGTFKGVIKVPQFMHTTLSTNAQGTGEIGQVVTYYIPLSSFANAGVGFSGDAVEEMYKKYYSGSAATNLNPKMPKDSDMQKSLTDTYYPFTAVEIIPNQGTDRMMLDQMVNKEYGGSKMQGDEYGSNIDQSYSDTVNEMLNVLR